MNYKRVAYASSTRSTYCSMRNAYLRFCLYFGKSPVPAEKDTLLTYMVFLARSLSASSISSYMNVIRLMHLEAGFENPLDEFELSLLSRGIKRTLGRPPSQKLPITPEILLSIRNVLNLNSSKDRAFWCACIVGFLGFFRKSTLLPKNKSCLKQSLLIKDVSISNEGDVMNIIVRHTKTIQFGQRVLSLPFYKAQKVELCPVRAMIDMLAGLKGLFHHISDQPLFSFVNEVGGLGYLDHCEFVRQLKHCIKLCGLDVQMYSGHSFRRGGCTFAFALGLSPVLIKLRGDWRSNAYERYVTVSESQQLGIARALSTGL